MEHGGPEVLEILELPECHAGPGEIKLRVRAAAVNPSDTLTRAGTLEQAVGAPVPEHRDPPPYVPGLDAAGVAEEIGDGADTALNVGDEVMAVVIPQGSQGAYCEYVTVPAATVVRTPQGMDLVSAATFPMNALTANGVLEALDLAPGQTIAVTGAAGALGGAVVELAKAGGLTIIADSSEADEGLVRSLGADIIVRRGDHVADRIRAIRPDGVDGLVDAALQNDVVLPAVRDHGRIVTVRGHVGADERGITWCPVALPEFVNDHARLDRVRRQVEAGQLRPRVAEVFPVERAADAHRLLEAGGVRGRLVLAF
jgi:NADPH:quinone reductase